MRAKGPPTVGPYRVVAELTRGGMGTVYLAERADGQFEQRVALKLVKRGMDSEEVLRCFLAERRILARLQHPNIARLVGGGMTESGQPWFAMEYVHGIPITAYCDQRRSSVADRLRLLEDVCRAVRYAHQNLIIHRDLKPSNVLVTDDGDVKLLDFGIAKLLREDAAEPTDLTQRGLRVMTPAYAAPEQVRGEPVTTATDVYALGVMMYELLTGRCAQRLERHSPLEVERMVCRVDPEIPSSAVMRTQEMSRQDGRKTVITPEEVSSARATDPPGLRRQLRGDLDTVVLKTLRKEPALRYPSTDALIADIQRYLTGMPVQARPVSTLSRAVRFLGRHRIGAGAIAALLVALVAGLVGMGWQARAAYREAAEARAVKEFVKDLFRGSMPADAGGREVTARKLLDRGARRVDSALAGQPEVQLELLDFLGTVHNQLGYYDRADTLFQRATSLAESLHGRASPQVAAELSAGSEAVWQAGEYARADSMLQKAIQIHAGQRRPDLQSLGEALSNRATVLGSKGEYARAESLFRSVVHITREVYGADHLEMAIDLSNLGLALLRLGRLDQADSALRGSLAIRRRLLDPGHPALLFTMHNLAVNLLAQGNLDRAESLAREVAAKRRRLHPDGHPDLAITLQVLHKILAARGQYAEAESLIVEALAIRQEWLGADHPQTLDALANLGMVRYWTGDLRGAEAATRDALAGYRIIREEREPTAITIIGSLGVILRDEGKYLEAEALLNEALSLRLEMHGDSSAEFAAGLRDLGVLYHRQGRLLEAERVLRQALSRDRARLPPRHPATAEALSALGACLLGLQRPAEAMPLLREALLIRRDKHGPDEPRTLATLGLLGEALTALRRYDEAEPLLRESFRGLLASRYGRRELPEARRRLADVRSKERFAS